MPLFGNKYNRFAFLDVETTGGSARTDRVTEIGLLVYEDGKLIKTFSKLINPGRSIPYYITTITGITDQMVQNAPVFNEIAEELFELLQGGIFVAHNAGFDYGFIQTEFKRVGFDFSAHQLCTVKLSRMLYPEYEKHNLDAVMERLGIECSARHRAFEDAEVLMKFYEKVVDKYPEQYVVEVLERIIRRK